MRILGWITVGVTFLLMVWGNIVSSTGSGLACPDWPLCHGTLTPTPTGPIILEWGHRILAFTATLFILTLLYRLFTTREKANSVSSLKKTGMILLGLLFGQILLGGTTVLLGLSPLISTIHLLIATFVLSGLILIACAITWDPPALSNCPPKIGRLANAGLIGLLVQFALGGLVRHTHSGLACPKFPNCLDTFLPIPFIFETFLAFTHRWWGVLMVGVFFQISLATARAEDPQVRMALARSGRRTFGLALAQIILGVGTVMGGLNSHSRATHALVGYALWANLFYIAIRAGSMQWLWRKSARTANATVGLSSLPSYET